MISVRAGRSRPKDRKQTDSDKQAEGSTQTWPAPVEGLVTAPSFAASRGARVLENFWPTPGGIEPRGGLSLIGTAAARIVTLFDYTANGQRFYATATEIRAFTDTGIGAAAVTGLTNGSWSTFEVQNAGGSFLIAVNGTDAARRYDGTSWTNLGVTGVDTSTLSFVWGYRNRVFFVQKGALKAWYLDTNSIGGAAVELPLSATFNRGGALLAGATWSSDAGDGMDDKCVLITDQGEVAVFSGSNPGSLDNWSLEGVYYIGRILGPRAFVRIGGDLIFATVAGLVPLSGAVTKAPAALQSVSMTDAIAPDWAEAVSSTPYGWRLTTWDRGGALFALAIGAQRHLVANLNTAAWMTLTGWPVSDMRQMGDGLYMADTSGGLYRAWVGGSDDGRSIVCRAALAPDHLGNAAALKRAHMARPVWRHVGELYDAVSIGVDYETSFPSPPNATMAAADNTSFWDTATWDVSLWGGDGIDYRTRGRWQTVAGVGQALAPQVQVVTASPNRPVCQLQRVDVQFTSGGIDL